MKSISNINRSQNKTELIEIQAMTLKIQLISIPNMTGVSWALATIDKLTGPGAGFANKLKINHVLINSG